MATKTYTILINKKRQLTKKEKRENEEIMTYLRQLESQNKAGESNGS